MALEVDVAEAAVVDDPDAATLLDATERARAARKREPLPFLAAHALMRRTLGARLGVDPAALVFAQRCATCGSDQHGKPSIVGHEGTSFSLSYTDDVAVLAVAGGADIGIDVEEVGEADFGGFTEATLAEEEIAGFAALTGTDLLRARAQVWARKEAVLKATGHGLVVDPTEILVSGPGQAAAMLAWRAQEASPGPVALADVDLRSRRHRASVAALSDQRLIIRTVTQ